mgnify:CR=1 FL=1
MKSPNKMIGGALAGITGGLTNVLGATEESKGSDIQNQAAQAAALTRRNLGGVASTMGPGLFGGALAGASGMSGAVAPEASQTPAPQADAASVDPSFLGVGFKGSGRVVGQNNFEGANQITDLAGQAAQPVAEPQKPAADLSTMTAQERYYNKYA